MEHAQLESDHFVEHYDFDDEMREHYTKQAEILDDEIRKERSESKKARLVKTADTYYEAISEVEGLDKGEAVDWIQNHAGGKKSSEMADAVEVGGFVWSRQTACHRLSSWEDILGTVSYLISKKRG